jgi:hypothetical protein
MSGERPAYVVLMIIALSLPLMSLLARRISPRHTLRLILLWIAIFAGGTLLVMAVAPVLGYHLT